MSKILTGDYRLVKNLNSHIILNLIRTKAPISGATLAKITGMRPSTILKILRNLHKNGLILKVGQGDSTRLGGRPPTLWEICGNYGYVVGIQLELNEVHAVLIDLNSQIISEKIIKIKHFKTLAEIESRIIEIIDKLLQSKRISRRHLLGLGIGVSGLVNSINGSITKTSLLPSSELPIMLGSALEKKFDFPIYIENDANAAALAEKWFNQADGMDHMVFALIVIDCDVFGIGFGLIFDNNLYRGANMIAGETTAFDINIKKILNDYCNYTKSSLKINSLSIPINELEFQHLLKALEEKNEIVIRFFQEAGKIVGNELIKVLNLLDPSVVVIGGEVAKAKNYILDPIRQILEKECPLTANQKFSLIQSSLDNHSVALGAATIILQKIFQGPVVEAK